MIRVPYSKDIEANYSCILEDGYLYIPNDQADAKIRAIGGEVTITHKGNDNCDVTLGLVNKGDSYEALYLYGEHDEDSFNTFYDCEVVTLVYV